jgi:CDP-glucose 4,6-dehydratase
MSLIKFYQGKKIFITGHTGFKGCWLSLFLEKLGAEITGYALKPIDYRGNLFNLISLDKNIHSIIADIRNYQSLKKAITDAKPDIIFHLAAQAIVRDSYQDPLNNYDTNIMGTVNLLDIAKDVSSVKAVINITTDKCYENNQCDRPYHENDQLGGYDPYSTSKACSELINSSYRKSFYQPKNIGLASARAGNVIGGGDFAKDRIIPDLIEAISKKESAIIRNPLSIRPWQYVLDVLNGYLILGQKLYQDPEKYSEAFNFSPKENTAITVKEIADAFIEIIGYGSYQINQDKNNVYEAQTLKLDSSKAADKLRWTTKYDINDIIKNTGFWYKGFLQDSDIKSLCDKQLKEFIN